MTKNQKQLEHHYLRLVEDLQSGKRERLREVYEAYRDAFTGWATARYHCSEDQAREVYQEVILAFYENVMNGKINTLNSKLQTYLFGIGRNMLLKEYQKNSRFTGQDPHEQLADLPDDHLPSETIESKEQILVVQQALEAIGTNCKNLLVEVYYHQLSGELIARKLGYKNADVVKSQKARCMKQLRTFIQDLFSREDL